MEYVAIACGALLSTVFGVSGAGKIRRPVEFAASVGALRLLPPRASGLAASLLTAAELLVAVLLPVSLLLSAEVALAGFAGSAALSALFCAVIVITLKRGIRATCNCFGRAAAEYSTRHVVRNAALVLIALGGAGSSLAAGPVHTPATILAIAVGLVLGILVVAMDDLVALFHG
ncbi:MauE/DoxX family redox-associated membrane protein [Planomonospora corallina]|uniref:MauE/DoxX family redox-associated membrane protein n=1 Tax=Planomonospora corallina TaxID=1806052 RepID=A0ABV8IAJ9_9ACTN